MPKVQEEEVVDEKQKKQLDIKKAARNIKFYSYVFLAFLLLLVTVSNCFVRVEVSGSSMETTYTHGQIIWASKWKKPTYGSVVILNNPYYGQDGEPKVVLKRLRGTGGDKFWFDMDNNLWRETKQGAKTRVQIGVDDGMVFSIFMHNKLKAEGDEVVFTEYFMVYTVPEGCYFMLGDNIDVSKDGRYYGAVKKSSLIGVIYD